MFCFDLLTVVTTPSDTLMIVIACALVLVMLNSRK